VPRDLETVVLKAMAKRPQDRYQSARELADDLRRFLATEPIRARRVGPVGRLVRWARRNPTVASLLFAVLLTFAAGTAAASYFAYQAAERERDALWHADEAKKNEQRALDKEKFAAEKEKLAIEKEKIAVAAQKRGLTLLYETRIQSAHLALRGGEEDRACQFLEAAKPTPGEEDLRGWEWHYLARLLWDKPPSFVARPQVRLPPQVLLHTVRLSDDGARLATVAAVDADRPELGFQAEVWDTRQKVRLFTRQFKPSQLPDDALEFLVSSLRADGRALALGSGNRVIVWEVDAGRERVFDLGLPVHQVALDPTGRRFACVVGTPDREAGPADPTRPEPTWSLQVWDLAEGAGKWTLCAGKGFNAAHLVGFGRNGRSLLARDPDRGWVLWKPASGKERLRLTGLPGVREAALSPDGELIAGWDGGDTLHVFDADSGKRLWSVPAPGFRRARFAGDRLVVLDDFGRIVIHDLDRLQPPRTLRWDGHTPSLAAIALTPEGALVAADRAGTVAQWDLSRPPVYRVPGSAVGDVGCDHSADGRRLVVVDEGQLRLYDAVTGRLLGVRGLVADGFPYALVALRADGRLVALATPPDEVPGGAPLLFPWPHSGLPGLFAAAWTWSEPSPHGRVKVIDPDTGRCVLDWLSPWETPAFSNLTFSPTNRYLLAVADGSRPPFVWDLEAGRELHLPLPRAQHIATFSPDDRQLAVWSVPEDPKAADKLSGPGTLTVWDLESGRAVYTRTLPIAPAEGLALPGRALLRLSPDGRRVAVLQAGTRPEPGGAETPYARLYALDLDGGPQSGLILDETLRPSAVAFTRAMEFHPDGRVLALGVAGELSAWDLTTRKKVYAVKGYHEGIAYLSYADNGRRLIVVSELPEAVAHPGAEPDRIHLLDAATGAPLLALPLPTDASNAVTAMSFDGTTLRVVLAGADYFEVRQFDGAPLP
jgi:WD40 repeat protein